MNQSAIARFGSRIQQLIDGQSLDRRTCYEMFREVLSNTQPELQQGAFLAALVAKGETAEEITGAWQAIDELDTVHVELSETMPLVENSGTGMDRLKTFNASSAAGIIAAAGGTRLARHGARALTSRCGTVDLLEMVGIDVDCDAETVAESIRQTGIGLFNGMSPQIHPGALGRILSQIRFGSTLNIAASLANPACPTHGLRGVYSESLLSIVPEVMREIGYRRGIVVHGFDANGVAGMDEISNIGETVMVEFGQTGALVTERFVPEDLGMTRARYPDISALGNPRQEAIRFLEVIAGRGPRGCSELSVLNAGAVMYVGGQADSLQHGVQRAQELLGSGAMFEKLVQWVQCQGTPSGRERFEACMKEAKLA